MPKPRLTDEQKLMLRLERAREAAPPSEKEARVFLTDLGMDVDAEFGLLKQTLAERDEAQRRKRFADADARYRDAQARRTGLALHRSREENLATLAALQRRNPDLTAHHRDLAFISDDDLGSLVQQLEELEADEEEG